MLWEILSCKSALTRQSSRIKRGSEMKMHSVIVLLVGLAGCGGRVALPVQTVQAIDPQLTCDHMSAEFDNNARRGRELAGEKGDSTRDNLGFITMPLFLDIDDTQKKELAALIARNARLQELAAAKSCPVLVASVSLGKKK
jgi:hypothetical protein